MTFLLAALLALCAPNAVIAVRAQRIADNCSIVWIARSRVEQRVVAQRRDPRPVRVVTVVRPAQSHAKSPLLSRSLYQRPPPHFLL
jgi:hypothetical protein